ncbi:MAG: shikimate dehydrogenase [Alistipes sp.]|nr:shikimate dehydrogenase [Alistipes sp.]MBQ3260324.1 shikimate dehydrogenase [Alistipes sp.]
MKHYGLIGRPLGHSASARYFTAKFEREAIDAEYSLYELPDIGAVETMLPADIEGFNVTIPYKREIIPLLDEVSPEAQAVGAVNCVKCHDGVRTGYNTDVVGIRYSLDKLLGSEEGVKALVLGTGGASQAVQYVLAERGIEFLIVSRDATKGNITYDDLTPAIVAEYRLIINATPVGMYPHTDEAPALPYEALTGANLLFDTIYNPARTEFLARGERAGAQTINGEAMFEAQAEASWKIWTAGR